MGSSHQETETLSVGDIAPDFTLKTAKKEDWRLKDFRNKKNVVLAFVPYAFSSVCSTQLPSYEEELERFRVLLLLPINGACQEVGSSRMRLLKKLPVVNCLKKRDWRLKVH